MPALSSRARNLLAGAVVALQAGAGLWAMAYGPSPIHLRIGASIFFLAIFSFIGVFGLKALSRRTVSGAESGPTTAPARGLILSMTSAICVFFFSVAVYSGPKFDGAAIMMAFLSGLSALLGAWIGKIGPNPLIGVRTAWTYASRLAWDKSNRLTGRIWFWGGLIGLAAAPFAPQPAGANLVIVGVLAAWAAGAFESWRVWRNDPDRRASL